jgi:hypothetical protein
MNREILDGLLELDTLISKNDAAEDHKTKGLEIEQINKFIDESTNEIADIDSGLSKYYELTNSQDYISLTDDLSREREQLIQNNFDLKRFELTLSSTNEYIQENTTLLNRLLAFNEDQIIHDAEVKLHASRSESDRLYNKKALVALLRPRKEREAEIKRIKEAISKATELRRQQEESVASAKRLEEDRRKRISDLEKTIEEMKTRYSITQIELRQKEKKQYLEDNIDSLRQIIPVLDLNPKDALNEIIKEYQNGYINEEELRDRLLPIRDSIVLTGIDKKGKEYINRKREELESKKTSLQSQLDSLDEGTEVIDPEQVRIDGLKRKVSELDSHIRYNRSEIGRTNFEIKRTDNDISVLDNKINYLEEMLTSNDITVSPEEIRKTIDIHKEERESKKLTKRDLEQERKVLQSSIGTMERQVGIYNNSIYKSLGNMQIPNYKMTREKSKREQLELELKSVDRELKELDLSEKYVENNLLSKIDGLLNKFPKKPGFSMEENDKRLEKLKMIYKNLGKSKEENQTEEQNRNNSLPNNEEKTRNYSTLPYVGVRKKVENEEEKKPVPIVTWKKVEEIANKTKECFKKNWKRCAAALLVLGIATFGAVVPKEAVIPDTITQEALIDDKNHDPYPNGEDINNKGEYRYRDPYPNGEDILGVKENSNKNGGTGGTGGGSSVVNPPVNTGDGSNDGGSNGGGGITDPEVDSPTNPTYNFSSKSSEVNASPFNPASQTIVVGVENGNNVLIGGDGTGYTTLGENGNINVKIEGVATPIQNPDGTTSITEAGIDENKIAEAKAYVENVVGPNLPETGNEVTLEEAEQQIAAGTRDQGDADSVNRAAAEAFKKIQDALNGTNEQGVQIAVTAPGSGFNGGAEQTDSNEQSLGR